MFFVVIKYAYGEKMHIKCVFSSKNSIWYWRFEVHCLTYGNYHMYGN